MNAQAGYRRGLPVFAAAFALILCASSGLGMGTVARALVDHSSGAALTLTVASSPRKPTNTAAAPSATATSASSVAVPTGFTLMASVSPNQLSAGQRFEVVVTVVAQDGASPVQGLECAMRAPTDGTPPLFAQWPGPAATGPDGRASWSLLAPQAPPGRYAIEVIAFGQHQYSYHWDALVTIVAGNTGG